MTGKDSLVFGTVMFYNVLKGHGFVSAEGFSKNIFVAKKLVDESPHFNGPPVRNAPIILRDVRLNPFKGWRAYELVRQDATWHAAVMKWYSGYDRYGFVTMIGGPHSGMDASFAGHAWRDYMGEAIPHMGLLLDVVCTLHPDSRTGVQRLRAIAFRTAR